MPTIVRPNKINTVPPVQTFVAKDIQGIDTFIWDVDFDNDWNAIATIVNGLLDAANIAAGAITAALLAPGAALANLAALSITIGKLAVGAAVNAFQYPAVTPVTATANAGQQTMATLTVTTRGGLVVLIATTGGHVTMGGGSPTGIIRFRILRDGNPLTPTPAILDYNLTGLSAEFLSAALAAPSAIDQPPAGVHVYTLTVETLSAGLCTFATSGANPGSFGAVELA